MKASIPSGTRSASCIELRVTGGELRDEVDESTDMAAWFGLDAVAELPLVDLAQAALRFLSGNLDSAK